MPPRFGAPTESIIRPFRRFALVFRAQSEVRAPPPNSPPPNSLGTRFEGPQRLLSGTPGRPQIKQPTKMLPTELFFDKMRLQQNCWRQIRWVISMPQKLKRSPGTWVEGDRFGIEKKKSSCFIEYLRQGTHLRLVAQRRIGKTSLMREAARRLGEELWCLHIDLQKSHLPQDAIVEISLAARAHAPAWERVNVCSPMSWTGLSPLRSTN